MQCARPGPGISKKSSVASLTLFKLTRINGVCPFCYMQPVYQVWSCNLTLLLVAYKVWTDTPHHINKLAYVYGNISSNIISYSVLDEKILLTQRNISLIKQTDCVCTKKKRIIEILNHPKLYIFKSNISFPWSNHKMIVFNLFISKYINRHLLMYTY